MGIAEGRDEQPHWVVRREEVELTEEVLGRGGWGEVKVANFRGLRVAAKFLYDIILSDYNRQQFTREMTIASKIRHPNLLLFIGATREEEAVILTEVMPMQSAQRARNERYATSTDYFHDLLPVRRLPFGRLPIRRRFNGLNVVSAY